jgi:membrane-associated protease RseP (regulator of RpoE activity)
MAIRRLCTILAVLIVLGFCLPGMRAQKGSKPLAKEDVLELLTGDVPPERVAAIVRERGVSFKLTREVEGQIQQAGGNEELLKAIREFGPKPPGSPASKTKPATTESPAAPAVLMIEATPGGARVYIDDEPVGTTSPEGRLKLSTLSPGAHQVRLASRGFQDHEETLQLTSGETTRVATNLVAAPAPAQTLAQPAAPVTGPTATASGALAYLGVRPAAQQPVGGKGVVISDVAPGGPADRAGLRPNDTITSIGGREVRTLQDLQAAIASHQAGETVEVTWSSGNTVITTSIQLSVRPASAPAQGSHPAGEKRQ